MTKIFDQILITILFASMTLNFVQFALDWFGEAPERAAADLFFASVAFLLLLKQVKQFIRVEHRA